MRNLMRTAFQFERNGNFLTHLYRKLQLWRAKRLLEKIPPEMRKEALIKAAIEAGFEKTSDEKGTVILTRRNHERTNSEGN